MPAEIELVFRPMEEEVGSKEGETDVEVEITI